MSYSIHFELYDLRPLKYILRSYPAVKLYTDLWWPVAEAVPSPTAELLLAPNELQQTAAVCWAPERQSDCIRRLLRDPEARTWFREVFLRDIFAVEDASQLFSWIAAAAADQRNQSDLEVYIALQQSIEEWVRGMRNRFVSTPPPPTQKQLRPAPCGHRLALRHAAASAEEAVYT